MTTYNDDQKPVIQGCPTDESIDICNEVVSPASALSIADNGDSAVSVDPVCCFNDAGITRTWMATDSCGTILPTQLYNMIALKPNVSLLARLEFIGAETYHCMWIAWDGRETIVSIETLCGHLTREARSLRDQASRELRAGELRSECVSPNKRRQDEKQIVNVQCHPCLAGCQPHHGVYV
jgi:hypothetical protein